MKSIWIGSISFGLVNIPVKLFSAVQERAVKFKLLHKKDKSPIKYKKFCEKEGKEVDWKDIAKGLEIGKEKYVILTDEELEKLKPAKSSVIEVLEFIDSTQIDPISFNKHYLVAPESEKEKAYFLFREVLQSRNKIAIAKFVMREKEYVAVISAYKNGLLISTLNYAYETRDFGELEELKNPPSLKKEEIDLADELINKLYTEEFQIEKFKDTFLEQIKSAIKRKEEGEIIEISKPKTKQTKNLVEALKASLR